MFDVLHWNLSKLIVYKLEAVKLFWSAVYCRSKQVPTLQLMKSIVDAGSHRCLVRYDDALTYQANSTMALNHMKFRNNSDFR